MHSVHSHAFLRKSVPSNVHDDCMKSIIVQTITLKYPGLRILEYSTVFDSNNSANNVTVTEPCTPNPSINENRARIRSAKMTAITNIMAYPTLTHINLLMYFSRLEAGSDRNVILFCLLSKFLNMLHPATIIKANPTNNATPARLLYKFIKAKGVSINNPLSKYRLAIK